MQFFKRRLKLFAINYKFLSLMAILWLLGVQLVFFSLQQYLNKKSSFVIKSQIETSITSLNYDNIIRSLSQLQSNRIIHCLDVKIFDSFDKNWRIILAPQQLESCEESLLKIYGAPIDQVISLSSGIIWSVKFRLVNDILFISLLWMMRVLGFFLILVVYAILNEKKQRERLAQDLENASIQQIKALSIKVAHDIRSPLSVINLISSKLRTDNEEVTGILNGSLQRLNDIANNLLASEKSLSTNFSISVIDLRKLFSQIVNEKYIEYKGKISFKVEFLKEKEDFKMSANSIEIQRILSNLINNSYESKKNKTCKIIIKVFKKKDIVFIKIEDFGLGMSKDLLEKLGKTEFTTKIEGNGLGVKYAKQYLNSVGGDISYFSEEGAGTRALIILKIIPP